MCVGTNLTSSFVSTIDTIADNACLGDKACAGNRGDVSEHACIGESACAENQGAIGYKSCDGLKTCYNNLGQIGFIGDVENIDEPEGSCKNSAKVGGDVSDPVAFLGACEGNRAKIEDASCDGNEVCYFNNKPIGISSCINRRACYRNDGGIQGNACQESFSW